MPRKHPERIHKLQRKPPAIRVAYQAILGASFLISEGKEVQAHIVLTDALRKLNSEYTKEIAKEVFELEGERGPT